MAIDALMRDYTGAVPGAALLVVRDGEAIASRGFGLADLDRGIAVTPSTSFRLASVTKQFTAAAILLLAQDGRLALDDRARRWLPELPVETDRVTLCHLLNHTSGLIDYEDVMAPDTTVPLRDADVLRLLAAQHRTYFEPGSNWRYSNSGYTLLALIVEIDARPPGRGPAGRANRAVAGPAVGWDPQYLRLGAQVGPALR